MKNSVIQLWDSPTFNTWGSYATRALGLLVVVPLILRNLDPPEIALWYLFASIIGLQMLADLGFAPTFVRAFAYAMGGATELKELRENPPGRKGSDPNWEFAEEIWASMKFVYARLTALSLLVLAALGTIALLYPVSQAGDEIAAWVAWGVIVTTSGVSFFGSIYGVYLQGINQVAVFRRWETLTSLAGILTSFLVLAFGGRLLELVLANQAWVVVNVARNRWLCRSQAGGQFREFRRLPADKALIASIWPSAWRSGLGVLMSFGVVQATGIVYAQFGSAGNVAAYLFSLRLIQTVNQFAQAPFYSRLPILARLRVEGNLRGQVSVAQRGMVLAYWTFLAGFIGIGLSINPLLGFIKSNIESLDLMLWSLLGAAFFAERYGAMHIQLYSITNHIIWHVATGISGVINITVALALFRTVGVYAFPIGILAGNLGFYCWYAAVHSYQAFNLDFWTYERKTLLAPLGAMVVSAFVIPLLGAATW